MSQAVDQPAPPVPAPAPSPSFRRIAGWTVLGSLVPGLGYLRSGRRTLGRAVLGGTVLAVVALAAAVLVAGPVRLAQSVAFSPAKLAWAAAVLALLAVLWGALVLTTHQAVRGAADLSVAQGIGCFVVVVALVVAGALPALKVAHDTVLARDTLMTVFGSDRAAGLAGAQRPQSGAEVPPSAVHGPADPWAAVPRVNILLIGTDAGEGREGVRPDTLVVASVDTRTGQTVLFSLPRNLQRVPFPAGSRPAAAFPKGFFCINPANGANTDCLLNGVWAFAESHAGDWYSGTRTPGLTATIQAAEAVTGLEIGHYVMVGLDGFKDLVNAVGGITVTVRERLPIGGSVENPGGTIGWIEPGRQKLSGWRALWYARSRWSTNDFDRMRRQRCVLAALAEQADPLTLARNFPAIARAAQKNVRTDIALDDLDAWVELARRVQGASVRSLPFTEDVVDTTNPNFAQVHRLVRAALRAPSPSASASAPSPSSSAAPSTASSAAPSPAPSSTRSPRRSARPPVPPPSSPVDVRAVC
jgi:LCP family protein required for cell wall assembly